MTCSAGNLRDQTKGCYDTNETNVYSLSSHIQSFALVFLFFCRRVRRQGVMVTQFPCHSIPTKKEAAWHTKFSFASSVYLKSKAFRRLWPSFVSSTRLGSPIRIRYKWRHFYSCSIPLHPKLVDDYPSFTPRTSSQTYLCFKTHPSWRPKIASFMRKRYRKNIQQLDWVSWKKYFYCVAFHCICVWSVAELTIDYSPPNSDETEDRTLKRNIQNKQVFHPFFGVISLLWHIAG